MRVYPVFLFFISIAAAQPQIVIGEGLSGDELMNYVITNYKTGTTLGYTAARDTLYANIDARNDSLACVYTGYTIVLDPTQDPSSDAFNKGINCEHTWPQSLGAGNEPQRSDMHHLFPTEVDVNAARGNDPFADIPDIDTDMWYRLGVTRTSIPTENLDEWSEEENDLPTRFEPREDHKGNVARAMFYFKTMYDDVADTAFWNIQKDDLLQWHDLDPADQREYDRTMHIASYQEDKSNPFVLDSTLARRIWFVDTTTAAVFNDFYLEPDDYSLDQNYPNPLNPVTTIQYILQKQAPITLTVCDLQGREVKILIDGVQPPGTHRIQWNASQVPSGIYFYRLEMLNHQVTKKMVVIK